MLFNFKIKGFVDQKAISISYQDPNLIEYMKTQNAIEIENYLFLIEGFNTWLSAGIYKNTIVLSNKLTKYVLTIPKELDEFLISRILMKFKYQMEEIKYDIIKSRKQEKNNKPPIEIIPKKLYEEKRIYELSNTIQRYIENGYLENSLKSIIEWTEELNDRLVNYKYEFVKIEKKKQPIKGFFTECPNCKNPFMKFDNIPTDLKDQPCPFCGHIEKEK